MVDRHRASTETQLAVLLRLLQWHLDDVAHDLPAGRVPVARREELAGLLEGVAALVRGEPTVVETADRQRTGRAGVATFTQ